MTKRVEANDPIVMRKMGLFHCSKADYAKAFQYWTKAAGLGDASAHYHLAHMHRNGKHVEKDMKRTIYHWEEAAISGDTKSRYNLGCVEWNENSKERAVKYFIIAANLGDDESVKALKHGYAMGLLSKDDYAEALRTYQAAVDATKSPQREAACKSSFSFGEK